MLSRSVHEGFSLLKTMFMAPRPPVYANSPLQQYVYSTVHYPILTSSSCMLLTQDLEQLLGVGTTFNKRNGDCALLYCSTRGLVTVHCCTGIMHCRDYINVHVIMITQNDWFYIRYIINEMIIMCWNHYTLVTFCNRQRVKKSKQSQRSWLLSNFTGNLSHGSSNKV